MTVTNLVGSPLAGVTHWTGVGLPETFVTAPTGVFYTNTGTGHPLWVKSTGVAATGWVPVSVGSQAATWQIDFNVLGTLSAGAGSLRIPVGVACTVTGAAIVVNTAPTAASLIVDINKNGTTLFTTQSDRPTILAAGFASTVTVPVVTAIAAGDYLSIDIDQVGSSVAGANLGGYLTVTTNAT